MSEIQQGASGMKTPSLYFFLVPSFNAWYVSCLLIASLQLKDGQSALVFHKNILQRGLCILDGAMNFIAFSR